MRPLIMLLWVSASVFMPGAEAAGVLRLAHSVITLGGAERSGKLAVENVGDSPLYLDITQEQVQMPLTHPEVRIPVGDVTDPSLLISPPRLILAPGQKRIMNVVVLHEPQQRKIWRITFRPRERFLISSAENPTEVPLSVSIAYGVVIYQMGKTS